ncbi:hypothetical protein COO91_00483 [Nostoc flagelliforme CCNUN1]|uniref:Uncharacterized protein n=1 Tax=Nostoc flagelliforme CCNUN1 TaxID=2038116 RepID=A0A2K8SGQ6_9NOSO|nr:hypothetical protein COO91_00483 [Nostoc flagelliforme CCNUN1]
MSQLALIPVNPDMSTTGYDARGLANASLLASQFRQIYLYLMLLETAYRYICQNGIKLSK